MSGVIPAMKKKQIKNNDGGVAFYLLPMGCSGGPL